MVAPAALGVDICILSALPRVRQATRFFSRAGIAFSRRSGFGAFVASRMLSVPPSPFVSVLFHTRLL